MHYARPVAHSRAFYFLVPQFAIPSGTYEVEERQYGNNAFQANAILPYSRYTIN